MSDKPCPKCGHCPACGRSNAQPWHPPYQPIWINPHPWSGGSAAPQPKITYLTNTAAANPI